MAGQAHAVVVAFFDTREEAEDAREALSTRYQVSEPEPVSPPVDGRPWRVEITPPSGASPLYPFPSLIDTAVGIVRRFNGTTTQVDRNTADK